METLASKLLILGIISALGGGTGLLAPRLSEQLTQTVDAVAAPGSDAASEADAANAREHDEPKEIEHRALGHARRDAIRALNTSTREAQRVAREGGMSAAERAAMRELRSARREAIHALDAQRTAGDQSEEHRGSNIAIGEEQRASHAEIGEAHRGMHVDGQSTDDESTTDHRHGHGPSRGMTHGR